MAEAQNAQTAPKPNAATAAPVAAAGKPAAGDGTKTAATPKPKAEPKPPRYAPTSTIKLLEKDGKKFGPVTDEAAKTVNPKRAGSKSAVWFANYKDGMTIADLEAAYKTSGGSMNSNLDWDTKHGYIEIVPAAAK